MLNARGNIFSQKHTHMNSSDPRFWDFSFHEIGTLDLPVTIGMRETKLNNFLKLPSNNKNSILIDRLHFGAHQSEQIGLCRRQSRSYSSAYNTQRITGV